LILQTNFGAKAIKNNGGPQIVQIGSFGPIFTKRVSGEAAARIRARRYR
jgi:hypothetical protein